MFKKVMLPIDLEEADMTRQAIEAAVEIAGPEAELRLVNVQ
ncbi:MAG: universal stress protein, partial [Alphaproteobacteria bacterium]|nr:universal stress protein [Alphaproteobacteria bacterium]